MVLMPEADFYKKSVRRDELVRRYGAATVLQAEVASILNIMYLTRVMTPSEFIDIMVGQCRRIDEDRRAAANLDEDHH